MVFGPDWLANTFLFIFLFGLLFTVASLLLGFAHAGSLHVPHIGMHDGGHIGGHVPHAHLGGSGHPHVQVGHHDAEFGHVGDSDGPGILNMPTLMAFLTWFGGVGYILRHELSAAGFIAVSVALLSGAIGGGVMFVLLARVLWPMMSQPLNSSDYSLPGTSARVVSSIRAGGTGEIVYSKNGSRFTAGARSDDGVTPIAKGAHVVIMRYEKGLAYVRDVDAILNGDDRSLAADDQTDVEQSESSVVSCQ